MLPLILRQWNTFLLERLTIHRSTSAFFLTIHRQPSSNCLKWPTWEFQIYPVTRKSLTKLILSMKQHERIVHAFHQCLLEIAILKTLKYIVTERLIGSAHHIANMEKQILVNCSSSLWRSVSPSNSKCHKIYITSETLTSIILNWWQNKWQQQ